MPATTFKITSSRASTNQRARQRDGSASQTTLRAVTYASPNKVHLAGVTGMTGMGGKRLHGHSYHSLPFPYPLRTVRHLSQMLQEIPNRSHTLASVNQVSFYCIRHRFHLLKLDTCRFSKMAACSLFWKMSPNVESVFTVNFTNGWLSGDPHWTVDVMVGWCNFKEMWTRLDGSERLMLRLSSWEGERCWWAARSVPSAEQLTGQLLPSFHVESLPIDYSWLALLFPCFWSLPSHIMSGKTYKVINSLAEVSS